MGSVLHYLLFVTAHRLNFRTVVINFSGFVAPICQLEALACLILLTVCTQQLHVLPVQVRVHWLPCIISKYVKAVGITCKLAFLPSQNAVAIKLVGASAAIYSRYRFALQSGGCMQQARPICITALVGSRKCAHVRRLLSLISSRPVLARYLWNEKRQQNK